MLEVVFSDSAKGAMKMAKNYSKESMIGGAVGYIGKKPSIKELEKKFEGEAIGGNSKDVVCIGFGLDIGDIACEIDSQACGFAFLCDSLRNMECKVSEWLHLATTRYDHHG